MSYNLAIERNSFGYSTSQMVLSADDALSDANDGACDDDQSLLPHPPPFSQLDAYLMTNYYTHWSAQRRMCRFLPTLRCLL